MLDCDLDSKTAAELREILKEVRFQLRKHMMEQGHDRCWISDKRLYDQTLPEGCQAHFMLPPKDEWDKNCGEFCRGNEEVMSVCRVLCETYWRQRQPIPNVVAS
jgi:hypothetical protein